MKREYTKRCTLRNGIVVDCDACFDCIIVSVPERLKKKHSEYRKGYPIILLADGKGGSYGRRFDVVKSKPYNTTKKVQMNNKK